VGIGVAFSLAIYFLERKTDIAPDSLIGILFTSSLALGVVLMNFKKGYQPDLLSFLFGNILTIQSTELWIIIPLAAVILCFVLFNYNKYLFICLNDELAALAGIHTEIYRVLLYVLLAVSSILAIKMFGIILVSALLIIPVSFSKLFARSAKSLLALSIIFVEVIVIGGSILSLILDLPTGAVIVLTGTILFIAAMIANRLLSA
jgi:zinc transport system permease protein